MKTVRKKTIITFLISGITYASLGAGFDIVDGNGFNFLEFIFKASVFGLLMALMYRYHFKNDDSKKKKK